MFDKLSYKFRSMLSVVCRSWSRLCEARQLNWKGASSAACAVSAPCRASSPSLLDHDLQITTLNRILGHFSPPFKRQRDEQV